MPFSLLRLPSLHLTPLMPDSLRSWPSPSSRAAAKMSILSHPLLHLTLVLLLVLVSVSSTSLPFSAGNRSGGTHHNRDAPREAASPPASPPLLSPIQIILGGSEDGVACPTYDAPNPVAHLYPNNATGVLNATLAIMAIPISTARRLIPSQWAILERPMRAALPDFPEGMYPVLLQAAHDHDVQIRGLGLGIADFSRVGFEFPFVDLLGDGYSSFRWAPAQLISANNAIALAGSADYGTIVHPASFQPSCDAFEAAPSTTASKETLFSFQASSAEAGSSISLQFSTLPAEITPSYPLSFFRNITNQPVFANGTTCDQMIRLFNTTLSEGEGREPRPVSGRVSALKIAPFADIDDWAGFREVQGIRVATAFIENNYLDCQTMKGYTGTGGSGDS